MALLLPPSLHLEPIDLKFPSRGSRLAPLIFRLLINENEYRLSEG